MKKQPPIPPYLVIGFGILAMSTASIFIRYAQAEAPSLVIATARLLIASLVLLPLAVTRQRPELAALSRKDLLLGLLSGFFLALHFATWITSLEYTTVASSVVLVSTSPLWVALLSPLTIKEPLTRKIVIGLLIAMLGTVIIGGSDICSTTEQGFSCLPLSELVTGRAFWGDLLSLTGAWMAAGYLLIGRSLRAKLSLVSYIFVVYGMAALVLIVLMLASGLSLGGYSPQTYLWFLLLGLVPQLLGHSTVNWALGYLSAAFVSLTLLGEPIGSAILAYILLNEIPTPIKLFGAILILGGIIVASQKAPDKAT